MLHIGNIANNAFLNAKILNQHGFDCDVMCADYYHIMGCPEWEEADFAGDVGDHFQPDWTAVDLRGYQRPRWFAQGPPQLCLEYLIARRTGNARVANKRWQELGIANGTIAGRPRGRWRRAVARLRGFLTVIRERRDAPEVTAAFLRRFARRRGKWAGVANVVAVPVCTAAVWLLGELLRTDDPDRLAQWTALFREQFRDRADVMVAADIAPVIFAADRFKPLFALYDIIVGYAKEGVTPLIAGFPYFALEHGTLRELPYRDDRDGRQTALCYRMAQHVFVTNFDCLDSARYLAPGRFTLINHPFDEDAGLAVQGSEELRDELRRDLDSDVLFFFPTRHDWIAGTGYADKANDVFLRAFAALRREGFRIGAVCCEWGANVQDSKQLLDDLGCARYVRWAHPLPTVQFERMCRAADCVVDQFKLGAFGGVMFKAMAVGAPMLTYLDEAQLQRQFTEIPPVINCRTTGDIVTTLRRLLQTPDELSRYGTAARAWMHRHHGKAETVRLQSERFHHLLFPNALAK